MDKFEHFSSKAKSLNRANSESSGTQNQVCIPCHYQKYEEGSKNIILYFHGNAEDIGYASDFTRKLSYGLKADVISVEYPGYGVYEGDTNAKTILEDAEIVFDFLTAEMGVNPQNIIAFGRSIGSGPATHLAANRNPGGLILMSPYTSIKAVVKEIAGQLIGSLFAERFSNVEEIEKAECPCFFIHGKSDKLIPWQHSQELFVKCKALSAISLSETMTHNTFKLGTDIINPIRRFFKQVGIKHHHGKIAFPDYAVEVPTKSTYFRSRSLTAAVIETVFSGS